MTLGYRASGIPAGYGGNDADGESSRSHQLVPSAFESFRAF